MTEARIVATSGGKLSRIEESESEVAQLCLTLCDPMDCSLPGSPVHGIFQAIVLEWIAISFSRGSSQPRDWTWVSCIVDRRFTIWATREFLKWKWKFLCHVQLFVTPWTVALLAPLSVGILQARILEWVVMPSSGDLPNLGIEPRSPTLQADSLPSEP